MPVNSCILTSDMRVSESFPRAAMDLWWCGDCAFLWNASFDEEHVVYDESYEGTQAHSAVFRRYLADLAVSWLARLPTNPCRILEVGCGQGEFLQQLAGLTDAELRGYDPAYRGHDHRIFPCKLPTTASEGFDLVINRMTLEHIQEPLEFIRAMARWLAPGGTLITQVPDATRTLREGRVCDLFYEHVNYFTPTALVAVHQAAGLGEVETELGFDGQHLSIFARKTPAPVEATGSAHDELSLSPDALQQGLEAFATTWGARISAAREKGRDVWLWGTGSRATTFLSLLPAQCGISGAIDINPARSGTYILGTALETFTPEVLTGRRDVAVIVMNPIYADEIRDALEAIGASAEFMLLRD